MARLVLTTPEGQQIVELRPVNSLGRHPSNSIQLLDKIVSKEHCIIEQRGTTFVLKDLGSLNGTFINRDRVQGEQLLNDRDDIALGSTRARFEQTPPAAQPAPQHQVVGGGQAWDAGQGAQPSQGQPVPPSQGWPPATAPAGSAAAMPPSVGQAPAYQRAVAPQPPGPPPQRGPAGAAPAQVPGSAGAVPTGPRRAVPPPVPTRTPARGFSTAYLPQVARSTRVDETDEERQIGAQITAVEHEFLPFQNISGDSAQLRADYERLRLSYELSRAIANERDTGKLLEKILQNIFRFIPAQRGVIFLRDENDELAPMASYRNDGSRDPISVSTTIMKRAVEQRSAVLSHDAAMDFAASKGKSMILNQIQSAIVAPMLHQDEVLGVLWLDSKSLAQFQPKDLQLVTGVANQAAMFIEINILGKQVEEELVTRDRLSRLLSPNVAERVISGDFEVKPGGTRAECTVFNSDIRGFTRMSENTSPEDIVEMLNAYFEQMVETIFKFEGTLDKFMGDGIMALWGAPMTHRDDVERAVECAIEQVAALELFNQDRVANHKSPLGVGFGIHTGPVVAGYIGSSKALSYTVIGDVANTSARLCSRALAGQIVVSETTHAALPKRFECEEMPPVQLKGKREPMRVFNVIGTSPSAQVPAGGLEDSPTESTDPGQGQPSAAS